jgi:hypothetical protein
MNNKDIALILKALDDAIEYREPDNDNCRECIIAEMNWNEETLGTGSDGPPMCGDHQGDKEAVDEYRDFQSRLTSGVPSSMAVKE